MDQFVHLHLHTQYSLLDGANRVEEIIEKAKKIGQPAIGMTDHGNLHGAIEFYTHAKEIGIKPILGCELYVAADSRFEKSKGKEDDHTFHLTAIAHNMEGYKNLCRLSSRAYKEGFYFKPRVDHELLAQYAEGLTILSGCMAGKLSRTAERGDREGAKKLVRFYQETFGDNFYLEVQPHNITAQRKHNEVCVDLAKEFGVPLIATTDCHYPNKEDHYAQEVLMCISTAKRITDPDRLRHEGYELYLKSREEMKAGFQKSSGAANSSWIDEALNNTVKVAEKSALAFDFSKHFMPKFSNDSDEQLNKQFAESARAGLEARFETLRQNPEGFDAALKDRYVERLEREISLIQKMGFPSYMLVVADFIVWAKENGIAVGPGRGSVAGSLVAYAMRITDVDPIRHKLLFERFLNPDRVSLPDIDVDFCILGRAKVLEYVSNKYGKDRVAQIATFGTLKAKAAIKDVGRALGLSFAETDRIAQLVPAPRQGFDYPLKEALKMEPKLAEYAAGEGKQVIDLALRLEGLTRHASTHAAGVVIGDRPLMDMLPMMVDKVGADVTQYSMSYVEKVGLVKFDFLGLKTLTVITTAKKIIEESRNAKVDFDTIPLEDPKTYTILCAGNTTGVFQLESTGITEMTVRLKPNCFEDLVAILALYRPGPLDAGMVDHYINRKHGREPVTYLHPLMKNVLSDTYGIMLYQEQIMQLARDLSGYTLAEADLLRKAMGKKNPEEMARQKERFVKGAVERKIEKRLADEIFGQMETFARYGFNRSHSVAYAMVSFQTAYLKAHYGVEFMAALMTHDLGDSDKILKSLNECRRRGILVLPPDVNESSGGFSVRGEAIRYGLEAVKGLGEKAVEDLIAAREKEGPFKDLEDFVSRIEARSANRKVVESLIKCGAFDFTKVTRREMMESVDRVLQLAQVKEKEKNSNQISLFAALPTHNPIRRQVTVTRTALPEWPQRYRLKYEREALGFYISGHPLEKYQRELKRLGAVTTSEVRARNRSFDLTIGGVVTALKLRNTKKGDRYASFTLEDFEGVIEALVWPDVYRNVAPLLEAEDPVLISGKADITDERCTLIAASVESLVDVRNKKATYGLLSLISTDQSEKHHQNLLTLFSRHSGRCPIKVKVQLEQEEVSFTLKNEREAPVCVSPSEMLCEEVEQLFGRPVLSFLY